MGIVDTDTNYVIGKGPRVQFKVASDVLEALPDGQREAKKREARRAERLFNKWMRDRRINLPDKLRTAWRCRLQDGEPFIQFSTSPEEVNGISLYPELVECDRITWPAWETLSDKDWVDGVKLKNGLPVEYRVLKQHPGDMETLPDPNNADTVKAKNMIHWFKSTRPEQHRGIPALAPAVPLFEHLRRLTLATIKAAETAADLSLILYTNQPVGDTSYPIQPMSTFPMEAGMMFAAPDGWEPKSFQGAQPSQEYPAFKREIVTEMARPISMPFNIAACDSSDYNYASGRLDHQTYFNRVRIEQDDCEIQVLSPIVEQWLTEAREAYGLTLTWDELEIETFWKGLRHVDPLKEASANDKSLKNGTATLDMVYAEMGLDFESEAERAAETMGISVRGYKRLISQNLFEGVTDGNNNNTQASAEIREALQIAAEYEGRVPENTIEQYKLKTMSGDIGTLEMRDALQTASMKGKEPENIEFSRGENYE